MLIVSFRYFHLDASKPEPAKVQVGVIRTNCMDNLDRTNVGQSAIAKRVLTRQLQALGILHDTDTIDRYEDFMKDFRESMSARITIFPPIHPLHSVDRSCQLDFYGVQRHRCTENRLHKDRPANSSRHV